MPARRRPEDPEGGAPPPLSPWQRLLLFVPSMKRGKDAPPLGERLKSAIVKPPEPGAAAEAKAEAPPSVEELEHSAKYADDRERLVGLLAAPFGGVIGILIIGALVSHDPSALLKSGQANKLHVSVSLYHELEVVLLVLSALMVVTAMARKRLYLGMVMALYGLAVFNLHYWGFGVPYLMFGAWLLVRAYRANRALREATGGTTITTTAPPRSTKRYAAAPPKWMSSPKPPLPKPPKPDKEQRAG